MASVNRNESLPDYERPPVVETVLGVQFDPIRDFGNAQLGAFWKTLDQSEWADVTDAPPLLPQSELFGDMVRLPPHLRIQLSQELRTRLQIKNGTGDRMIQIQNGRLHFNWLDKRQSGYPRYRTIREGFSDVLQRFVQFIAAEKIGEFRPTQWEVSYVNFIPKGTVWNRPADWGFFKPLGAVPDLPGLAEGESFAGEWHFVIPGKKGRLHILWQHGLIPLPETDRQEAVTLTLTARGPIAVGSDHIAAVDEGLELGHKTIVRSFRELMSVDANSYWGLKT